MAHMATKKPLPEGWVYLGGKSRRYKNEITGETLSRRQFDQTIGRLKETGLTFERQAKKNKEENPLQSALRPKRGRKKLDEQKQFEKQIKQSKRELQETGKYIAEFTVEPVTEYNIANAINAIASTKGAYGYRRVLTFTEKETGIEISNSTPYKRIPKNVNALLDEINDLDEIESGYSFADTYTLSQIKYIVRIR